MFEGFANVWTPLTPAARLTARPLRVEVAGEAVVLFRTAEGAPAALLDRCPHRGVALSLGRVLPDGCLECPFHGWRFGADGANRHVPLNPDARRDLLGAVPLPVRIIGDLIWLYTAPGTKAPTEPHVPEGLVQPGITRVYTERLWQAHWTRAMENMLDSPHLPFVHARTIGRPLRRRMTPQSSLAVSWEDTSFGGRSQAVLDGAGGGGVLEFHRPNIMALHIPIPGRHLRIHALVVPVDGERTRLTVVGSRDFLRWPMLNPLFARLNGRIADEDRDVVQSSRPAEVPPPGMEPSVATDRATLQFRKYYYDTLKTSAV